MSIPFHYSANYKLGWCDFTQSEKTDEIKFLNLNTGCAVTKRTDSN